MSITVKSFDGGGFAQYSEDASGAGRFIRQFVQLVFSGSYVTGGDTLDLTNAGGTPTNPNTIPPAASYGLVDIDVAARSSASSGNAAGGGFYIVIAPNTDAPLKLSNNDLSTLKLKIFTGGTSELSAGAYPASVTGDVVVAELVYAR